LLVLAFVPLFFAIASIGRASLAAERVDGARLIARVVAADLDVREHDGGRDAREALEAYVKSGAVAAIAVYDSNGALALRVGDEGSVDGPRLLQASAPFGEQGAERVVVRIRPLEVDRAAPLVRLVAIYVGLFAIALLVFAYFVLTRVIVRPVESLALAATRIASGSRSLVKARTGAREIQELDEAFRTMATHLLAEEEKLRTKVEELTRTTGRLTEANTQLERSDRMASVGRLAAGVAHEIGNPLAALLGLEELVLDGGLDAASQRDFLVRMKRETERINGVVRDLLDFARADQTEGGGSADVKAVFDDVVALVRPQKELRGVEVVVDVEAGLQVALSPNRLTQVVLNLVFNAAGALNGAPGSIRLRARKDGDVAHLEVEDTGPGIPENMREAVFEPFVTTKDVGTGTGLGLSVCRGIVAGAKGTIVVDGSYRDGARLVIQLPLRARP
jgi:signal transduction histidine kinase